MSALLIALPAASTAGKATTRPEFSTPGPDAPGQLLSAQMTDSEQKLSSSLNHVAFFFFFLLCQIEVMSKPSSAAEWLTSSDEF